MSCLGKWGTSAGRGWLLGLPESYKTIRDQTCAEPLAISALTKPMGGCVAHPSTTGANGWSLSTEPFPRQVVSEQFYQAGCVALEVVTQMCFRRKALVQGSLVLSITGQTSRLKHNHCGFYFYPSLFSTPSFSPQKVSLSACVTTPSKFPVIEKELKSKLKCIF